VALRRERRRREVRRRNSRARTEKVQPTGRFARRGRSSPSALLSLLPVVAGIFGNDCCSSSFHGRGRSRSAATTATASRPTSPSSPSSSSTPPRYASKPDVFSYENVVVVVAIFVENIRSLLNGRGGRGGRVDDPSAHLAPRGRGRALGRRMLQLITSPNDGTWEKIAPFFLSPATFERGTTHISLVSIWVTDANTCLAWKATLLQ